MNNAVTGLDVARRGHLSLATATVNWAVKMREIEKVSEVLIWVFDHYGIDCAANWFSYQVLIHFDDDTQVWLLENLNAPFADEQDEISASEMGGDRK